MVIVVVLPFAAWSRAAWTTFSELEHSADVAWNKDELVKDLKLSCPVVMPLDFAVTHEVLNLFFSHLITRFDSTEKDVVPTYSIGSQDTWASTPECLTPRSFRVKLRNLR